MLPKNVCFLNKSAGIASGTSDGDNAKVRDDCFDLQKVDVSRAIGVIEYLYSQTSSGAQSPGLEKVTKRSAPHSSLTSGTGQLIRKE